jgi:hypothetical protein
VLHEIAGLLAVDFATAYAAIAWLAWVPNLAIASWLTRTTRATPLTAPATG